MSISENLKRLRKERGLTQKRLGELCGLAEITIRQYESGKYKPKIETIERMAQALDVPIVQIKEDLNLSEHRQTEEFKRLNRTALLYEAIEATLENIYGALEEKSIMGETGWEQFYWLVGKPPNTFILYEPDLETLVESTKALIPPIVERMKDTRPESEIVQQILNHLNKIPEHQAPQPPQPPTATQEGTDTTPPPDGSEGAQEAE